MWRQESTGVYRIEGKGIKLLSFLILIGISSAFAQQDSTIVFRQFWTDFNFDKKVDDKWSYGGDVGFRTEIDDKSWNQYYIRPSFKYNFNSDLNFVGGLANFTTWGEKISNIYELRFFQDLNYTWPRLERLRFNHRFRLEERFFWFQSGTNSVSIRPRYLIGATSSPFSVFGGDKNLYVMAQAEFFAPLEIGSNYTSEYLVNNARLHLAFGQILDEGWKYEFHYIWQKGRIADLEGLNTSEHLLRLRVYLKTSSQ